MSAEIIAALMPAAVERRSDAAIQESKIGCVNSESTGTDSAISQKAPSKNYEWILHPAIDLLFCCGGLLWVLFALHFFVVIPHHAAELLQILAFVSVAGTHLFSETHTIATLVRVFGSEEKRKEYSFYTHGAALAGCAAILAGLFVPGVTPILAKLYLMWVIQHFTAQTFGLCLLYCYKREYWLSNLEKGALSTLLNCTAVMAIIRQFTYKEWSANGFLAQRIPFWGPLPEWIFQASTIAVILAAVIFVGLVVKKAVVEKKVLPLPAAMLVLTGVGMFCVPLNVTSVLFLYAPAFFHGAQYIVLSSAVYLKEQGLPEGYKPSQIFSVLKQGTGLRYLGFLLMGAITVYLGIPRLLQEFGFNFGLAFATIFSVVSLHHFITDQAIWKLRDPKLRKMILS